MAINHERNSRLIEAYRSGQIDEARWQAHLRDEEGLLAHCTRSDRLRRVGSPGYEDLGTIRQGAAPDDFPGPIPPLFMACARCAAPWHCRSLARCCARSAEALPQDVTPGLWPTYRDMVEDLAFMALTVIGAITVLRWILDAAGVTAWLGWW